jgi:hypothetical protein
LLIGQLKMVHEGQHGNCSKIHSKPAVKRRVIKIGLRGKQIIFFSTLAEEVSNFLVFILFWKNETAYLKNKKFLR